MGKESSAGMSDLKCYRCLGTGIFQLSDCTLCRGIGIDPQSPVITSHKKVKESERLHPEVQDPTPPEGGKLLEWQPIASAPKDGTRLRLGHEKVPGFAEKDPHGIGAVSGDWDGARWRLSSYFVIPGGRHGLMASEPTHWMPLPVSPSAAS